MKFTLQHTPGTVFLTYPGVPTGWFQVLAILKDLRRIVHGWIASQTRLHGTDSRSGGCGVLGNLSQLRTSGHNRWL
jgi:hypothetical protein